MKMNKALALFIAITAMAGLLVSCTGKTAESASETNPLAAESSLAAASAEEKPPSSMPQNGDSFFEQDFTGSFSDSDFPFRLQYPKQMTLDQGEQRLSLSSAEPMVVLQIYYVQGGASFAEYQAELEDTFSDIQAFTVDGMAAVKGIQHVGQGAKINYVIDSTDGSVIVAQGVVDGLGSEANIAILDKIVQGIRLN